MAERAGLYYVYIIQSQSSKRYYIGVTSDVAQRIRHHNSGANASTKNKGSWFLVYKEIFRDKVKFTNTQYEATLGADALILMTEWGEFDAPDFNRLKNEMAGNDLFDLRNRWLAKSANSYGFNYYGVGRNYPFR